jgi:hypothetical protein
MIAYKKSLLEADPKDFKAKKKMAPKPTPAPPAKPGPPAKKWVKKTEHID